MPSVAHFIRELLTEDKYESGFSERIEERIQHLNAAQLQGMYNHLVTTMKNSKSDMWGQANKDIISKIEGLLLIRTAEAAKEKKKQDEIRLKEQHKIQLEKEANREKKRVMRMIADTALKTAELAVKEEESKRQAEEKVEIMRKVFVGEEKRNTWWKRSAVGLVVSVVVICVFVKDFLILIGCLLFVCLVAAVLAFKAYHFTTVLPAPVDENHLQQEIKLRQSVLKKQAISVLREKEQRFQEQVYRDKIEKKKRVEMKKNKMKFEAQLLESRRLEQIAMAKEVMSKKKALQLQQQKQTVTVTTSGGDALAVDDDAGDTIDQNPELVRRVAQSKNGESSDERDMEGDVPETNSSADLNYFSNSNSDPEQPHPAGGYLLSLSELDEDSGEDLSAGDFLYTAGAISGDNSNMCKLRGGLSGGLGVFSNDGEYSEYKSRPVSEWDDLESNRSSCADEDCRNDKREKEGRKKPPRSSSKYSMSRIDNKKSNQDEDSRVSSAGYALSSADHSGSHSAFATARPLHDEVELFSAMEDSAVGHINSGDDRNIASKTGLSVEDMV